MKNICDALKTNKSIKKIVFKNVWFYLYNREKYINFIVEILKGNTTFTEVNLDKNGIGDDGAAALADALKENTSITELNVGNNHIGDAGVTALAEALKMNRTLTTLSIPSESIRSNITDITDVGAIALAEALKNNRTLRTLNISNNSIDAVGAAALAEALKQNKTLEELDISYNNKFIYKPESGDGIAIALADALKVNRTLKKLKIEFIGLTVEGLEVLKEAVKSNDSIIIIISEMVKNFDETIKTEIDKLVRTSGSKFKKY
jgi:Ran GTPase-activating protein (RanGAP) involved in mRNA processing and transport